ncbi:hypothetical protein DDE82_006257 [Stemphylium lycopersici]|nr:hypothetical protein DDE82_006257 [Stemphylium lycopersici]
MSESAGMPSARSSRTHSFSSDRASSLASSINFQMPSTVRPSPAYIAASVASQTVTDHVNAQLREEDGDCDELQNAVFSEQALSLLNAFLDHLLFAFLSSARSPSLTAIRPAISDVLKPRLAREAMEAADEELQGLLAGEDDEEFAAHDGKTVANWDVEKIWKRTRLRIMVYTRLGELEDEDEERYVQQERGLSMDDDDDDEAGLVSWASAIFLTSVIEYVAEQLLLVSGTAAFARMASRLNKLAQQMEQDEEQPVLERLTIEEPDVEKIALNAALGRLWRTWRKRVRSPLSPLSPGRGMRSASSYSSLHVRRASRDTINTMHSEFEPLPEHHSTEFEPLPEHQPTETDIAANIPLPIGHNDVNEIEVPGLAPTYEDDAESEGMQTPIPRVQRPSSVLMLAPVESFKKNKKQRPMSMPMRPAPAFTVPSHFVDGERQSVHTSDESDDGDHAGQDSISPEGHVETPEDNSPDADASMVAFAAATGMGFRMSTAASSNNNETEKPDVAEKPNDTATETEPKVMHSKRMSIERHGPPGLVRTFSTRSSSLKSPVHTPVVTPKASVNAEGRSYLDDDVSDEDSEQHKAIGVAQTADNAVRSTSTTPEESPEHHKRPGSGGFVEVQPRNSTATSLSYRDSPPDSRPSWIPERSVVRQDPKRNSLTNGEITSSPTQHEGPTGPPRRQDAPRSGSRGSSLPALQEVDSNSTQPKEKAASIRTANRTSLGSESTKRNSIVANQDGPVQAPDRRLQRISTEESVRSQQTTPERSPSDKVSLKRGASASSSLRKQGAYPVASSGRNSSSSHRSRGLSGRMSEEDRAREFDFLVKGQDTVKFTLTPQNMRALDEAPVQKQEEPRRTSGSSVTVYPRASTEDKSFGTGNLPNTTAPRAKVPTAPQHKPSPSRKVVTRPLARDPKIDSESMRDFADFIRSTGPTPGQEKPVQPFVNISGNSQKSNNNSTSSLGRKMSTRQSTSANGSSKPKVSMEPRSPAGLSTGNGDLIDFIRQGPPDAHNGQPRIPRSVAPFRTTVDSDQFDSMLGGHGNVESAYGSAASTLESKDSTQTINSRTGLIPSPSVVHPAYSNAPQQLSGSMAASHAEPQITRTRRRVKDPYAIDFSDDDDGEDEEEDEDEDQLTALPAPTQPQASRQAPVQPPRQAAPRQESLMDFLNGQEPPTTSKPQPFMLSEETIAAARARAKASNPSTSALTTPRNGNSSAPPFSAVSSSTVASDAPRAFKPRLQARSPASGSMRGSSRTATSDLADFLKNSGPPEPPVSYSAPAKEEKKSRKFWKSSKKTYGDLP